MSLDLPKIRTFLTAADCLSFSQAAASLHTTQSNVSKQIAFLENEFGFRFFDRENGGIKLTPAGEVLRLELAKAFDHVEQGKILAQQRANRKEFSLHLGIFEGYGPERYVTDLINRLELTHPNLEVTMEWYDLAQLQNGMHSRALDMCLCKEFDGSTLRRCSTLTLGTGQPLLYISASHPLAQRDDLTLADLGDFPLATIQPKVAAAGFTFQIETLKDAGYNPKKIYLQPNLLSLVNYVLMGKAFCVADQNYRYFSLKSVRGYSIPNFKPARDFLMWREDNLNPAIPLMVECARQLYPGVD